MRAPTLASIGMSAVPTKKPFTLYGRSGSGSLAVQVALEEIGTPYECLWVGRELAEVARFKEVNPTGRVPALTLPDGTVMFESAAILIHLALLYPDARLAPQPGTTRHAMFLQWMTFLSANVYEAVLRIYYSARYSARGEADAAVIREQGVADFVTHVSLIARSLNPYVLGTEYSIADVYLYMLAGWYPDKGQLLGRVPALGAHSELLLARPAVAKVEADHAAHA
ncbi:MAG TPA: glutathione S-transferase family protein [Steroidobacteraceae bacterium]|nr:glutathione S-transferase family protein [Steroidobacteraceae bacterium]